MSDQPQYDVIVIGSGAGGGASAWALAKAGLKVLVLEAGPHYVPEQDYRLDKPDWELGIFPHKGGRGQMYTFGRMQGLERKWDSLRSWNHITGRYNPNPHRRGGVYSHVRGVGGSTLHFTGESHRLHPAAMHLRSRFGVGADWPFDYDSLETYYQQAEALIGVAGPEDPGIRHRSSPFPQPAHPMSWPSQQAAAACRQLNWNWVPNTLAVLSQARADRLECNYCGQCQRGCPRRDKGSVDVTFIPAALQTGHCTLLADRMALRLLPGEDKTIRGVEVVDHNGTREILTARAVVVACGAIETPRLLLLSRGPNSPRGVANETGQVGRHFLETLAWHSAGVHPQSLGSHRGLPSDGICWDFNAPDAIPGVVGGMRLSLSTLEADLAGPISYATRVVPGWGRQHKQALKSHLGRVVAIGAMGECLPHEQSYIDLDPKYTDSLGRPVARIHSYLDEMAIKRLAFMADKSRELLRAMGVTELFEEQGTYDVFNSTHVFGTCRMGTDPASSVVNEFGRAYQWSNLYVADASVFPSTGGGEAPSLTIQALALRTAEEIRRQLAVKTI